MTGTSEQRDHLRWETALDRLELDVVAAERMAADPAQPAPPSWDEPALVGRIPAHLVERAVALRERQRRVEAAMATTLGALGRQHDFATRVDRATRAPGTSVYLDVTA